MQQQARDATTATWCNNRHVSLNDEPPVKPHAQDVTDSTRTPDEQVIVGRNVTIELFYFQFISDLAINLLLLPPLPLLYISGYGGAGISPSKPSVNTTNENDID